MLTAEQIDRLDSLVEETARDYPRRQLPARAAEIAENWGVDATSLLRWIEAERALSARPCETPARAFRVLVTGTVDNDLVRQITAARSAVIAEVR